ncbi:hypothetical protein Tsubulata_041281, partial [Turnera subulata]
MVSEWMVAARLREVLRCSDIDTMTINMLCEKMEEEFGLDFSGRKSFIKDQVIPFLESDEFGSNENEEIDEDEEANSEVTNGSDLIAKDENEDVIMSYSRKERTSDTISNLHHHLRRGRAWREEPNFPRCDASQPVPSTESPQRQACSTRTRLKTSEPPHAAPLARVPPSLSHSSAVAVMDEPPEALATAVLPTGRNSRPQRVTSSPVHRRRSRSREVVASPPTGDRLRPSSPPCSDRPELLHQTLPPAPLFLTLPRPQ